MIALFYLGVPIIFAEGVGTKVREGFSKTLDRLSPLVRGQCTVDYYHGAFPLDGEALLESQRVYHEVVCPVADGDEIYGCGFCAVPENRVLG